MGKSKKSKNKNTKVVKPIKIETPDKTTKVAPSYIIGTIYLICMIAFLYVLGYVKNYEHINFISTVWFLLYFVIVFFVSKKYNNSTQNSILIPIKLFFTILGIAFFINFATTGINYIGQTNVESQNIFDIKKYATEITTYKDTSIYGDIENGKMFFVNEKKELNKFSEFDLVDENKFNSKILESTSKFFPIADSLKFSYIANSRENKVVLQWTVDGKRYLSEVSAQPIIDLLKEKDSYTEAMFKTDKLEIYKVEEFSLMLTFTEDSVQMSEFDTINDIKNANYIERINTFLNNHYDAEYVLAENTSGALIAERMYKDMKINLYSLSCTTCDYRYGNSDICEIINENTAYIFNLDIPSSLLKEGK